MTSILPLTMADDHVIDRTNWGVVFKQKSQLYNGENAWKHTFQVKLDFLDTLQMKHQALKGICPRNSSAKTTIFCRDLHRTVKIMSKMRHDALIKLNTTLREIFDLVPHTHIDNILHTRAERALLPFVADISKSLFGTARQKDLILLQNHIKTLTTQYNADQAIMHDTVNEMTSFMATANKRFDNAFTQQ